MKDLEDNHRALLLLEEISTGDQLTQRDLSDRAGMAVGLVNTYIKGLVAKGYVKMSAIPRKRYKYYLTPKGFIEKSRLTYELLQNYTRIFREARKDYSSLFHDLNASGIRRVYFAGVDEVAEIAYLSLQEVGMELAGVVDDQKAGERFFNTTVLPFAGLGSMPEGARAVITTYHRKDHIYSMLASSGVDDSRIDSIYPLEARAKINNTVGMAKGPVR